MENPTESGPSPGAIALRMARLLPTTPNALRHGVSGLVRVKARRHPDRPMIRTPETTLTYADVDRAANRLARFWRSRRVLAGEVVALLMGNRPEVILHQVALARIGVASALINTQLGGRPLTHALRAAKVRAAVVDGAHAAALATVEAPLADLLPGGAWLAAGHDEAPGDMGLFDLDAALSPFDDRPHPQPSITPDTVFTYLFTSGTTGLPKAAPIRHLRFSLPGAALQVFALGLTGDDVVFTPLPLYHASAQIVAWSSALAAGACLALAPRFRASSYWDDARRLGATAGVYVGELCRYLLNTPPCASERQHGIRVFVGNGLRPDVWRPFQARFGHPRIVEFYGATEGNTFLINANGKVGSCGRPVPLFVGPLDGVRLVRYDVETESHPRGARGRLIPCRPGETGELLGRIGLLPSERFDGYVDPDATDAKVLTSVFREGDRYFRSGDLLRRDEEGDYYFVDRIGDTFRWKGENVSTEEVACALVGTGGVEAAAVYGVEIPGCEGRAGMAAVRCGGDGLDATAVYERVREVLPRHAWPAFIRVREALETTSTLKLCKNALRREGYACDEPVFVRLDEERCYAPFTAARRAALEAGRLRL